MKPNGKIEPKSIKQATAIMKALDNMQRQKIIVMLEDQPLNVKEITIGLRLSQSVVSTHLSVLKRVGLVSHTQDGMYNLYALQPYKLTVMLKAIDVLVC